jgi:hypothetical protein
MQGDAVWRDACHILSAGAGRGAHSTVQLWYMSLMPILLCSCRAVLSGKTHATYFWLEQDGAITRLCHFCICRNPIVLCMQGSAVWRDTCHILSAGAGQAVYLKHSIVLICVCLRVLSVQGGAVWRDACHIRSAGAGRGHQGAAHDHVRVVRLARGHRVVDPERVRQAAAQKAGGGRLHDCQSIMH